MRNFHFLALFGLLNTFKLFRRNQTQDPHLQNFPQKKEVLALGHGSQYSQVHSSITPSLPVGLIPYTHDLLKC